MKLNPVAVVIMAFLTTTALALAILGLTAAVITTLVIYATYTIYAIS